MFTTKSLSIYKTSERLLSKIASRRSKGEYFRVVEVGARDGLQNEQKKVETKDKISLINRLSDCGFRTIEATSFVSPKWVPQLADHEEVFHGIKRYLNVTYPVLVPNLKGLDNALPHNVTEIAVFTAASDSFTMKNTNCSLEDSIKTAIEVTEEALRHGIRVRGYISTVIGCPYEGYIQPKLVAKIVAQLVEHGCYEVSLGDTIGIGNAGTIQAMLNEVLAAVPSTNLAVHFHDTYGQALSNVLVAVERGIRVADSSVAGLGGCPYAKGATGNLATEDLIYMLHSLGFDTGIDFDKLIEVSDWICQKMERANASRTSTAILLKKQQP